VENAVKHGMDPYLGPLCISIRTRHTDIGAEITVEDNGRGLSSTCDTKHGIALKNIRERLEIMCGGRLTIASGENVGTVLTMTIPDSTAS
ncbi:MAG TPA: sensor histidine kinase, partial [Lachnospiraceae bacterium]|nr:sensor histidine kinase [Lachnospiraceae bacterium]